MVDYMVDYVSRSPYVIGYYTTGDQGGAHRPQEIAFEMTKKPEGNDVIMVQQQESIYTRKHKFPYQFYQPGGENHNVQYAEEPRYHPRTRRTSPWKKIIHLIGTFLPLGLLLATLTPNVVRVNSTTTQPPIVLSKLRSADLPVEHKHARLLESAVCEDRSVCEMILAGGEPQSNILQNILWNLATRTPDNIAERNGLGEIFDAVKKKNCVIISC
ncbi:uncharacterized protein LOC109853461 [Pseudomyrmex gracilis]|uniref:uncharacterized protein LOC109853461 n=1 Tax=Pseudomyrmex gracilis TaxID=219809 RepID=UPI0009953704|nr:uncharacterized protein LOC109853461 [Pseudomyrmex gracilis]